MTLTTVTDITAQPWPRHIVEWALLELAYYGGAQVETVNGKTRWLNAHGYRATGAIEPVRHEVER